ncbi:MAG: sugar phosphate isomerase/epimerase family protein [Chloroflexota bacterium]
MRLGIVGLLPPNFADIQPSHLAAIRALDLTGVGLSVSRDTLAQVNEDTYDRLRHTFNDANMDVVQVGVGYRECLFDPDKSVRDDVIVQIGQGLEAAKKLNAQVTLIRTGSLNPNGPYSPCRENHHPDCRIRLLDTFKRIAEKAELIEQTVVIETHVVTIMNSPEFNAEIIEAVDSERLRVVMDYTNHFQALHQVYNSTERLNHIFDVMGPISVMGHCKDIRVRDGFVVHFDEEIPGEGELDLTTALRRWHEFYPDGYMMIEHLPPEDYPQASKNVHQILKEAHIPVY